MAAHSSSCQVGGCCPGPVGEATLGHHRGTGLTWFKPLVYVCGMNEQVALHPGAHVEKGWGEGLPCTLVILVLVLGEGGEGTASPVL